MDHHVWVSFLSASSLASQCLVFSLLPPCQPAPSWYVQDHFHIHTPNLEQLLTAYQITCKLWLDSHNSLHLGHLFFPLFFSLHSPICFNQIWDLSIPWIYFSHPLKGCHLSPVFQLHLLKIPVLPAPYLNTPTSTSNFLPTKLHVSILLLWIYVFFLSNLWVLRFLGKVLVFIWWN